VGEQLAAQPATALPQQQQQPAAATDATMTAATSIPVTMPADKPAEQPVAVGGAAAAEPAKESGTAAEAEGGEAAPAAKGKGKAPASGKKKRSQFTCNQRDGWNRTSLCILSSLCLACLLFRESAHARREEETREEQSQRWCNHMAALLGVSDHSTHVLPLVRFVLVSCF
jgi:hypothetical protein